MKELIVVVALAILGVVFFYMIIGPSDDSLKSKSEEVMIKTVTDYVGE